MKTANKNCDCELCLFKTFPYNNPLANDNKKIIEAIVYHYIVRLSSLVKSRKDLNSYIIKFIMTINQSYLESSSDMNELKTSINITYKNLTDLEKCCRFSPNASLTKLTHKEATYLKLIISSLEEENDEIVEVVSPIKIIVSLDEDAPIDVPIETAVTAVTTVAAVAAVAAVTTVAAVAAVTTVTEDGVLVDLPIQQDVSGSYLSYCSIS